ncbi:nucleoside hydrolase [Bacillus sp. FJAT-49711]|uniref:nucleoside hydrolase n=1 Tax=Bacillus sp. FJAT-49711 TaxID=2833585 RepID=UPI001BC9578A|nr:nucleoside hydrolase [Bacillus sp. FJAT-49711]MBS4220980.1 nucleoside hydrolase [Bacillus sp. FJAT-49711]
MIKILLDTDIGGDIDDAICLAYLLKEPQCDLLGITTVCGEPEKRAAVADAICKSAGKDIPIVAGLDTTLQPVPVYPTPDGARALEYWPHKEFEKADAPAFLYQKIKENPHEIVLLAIGNMTNVATLFRTYPDAPSLLKGLYVMNGYFGTEPLPEPYYNWNSWADPLASKIVFASNVSTHKAIPLEVTEKLTIESERASTLFSKDSDLMKAVFDFGNAWLESAGKLTLHDPLAAVSIFHPEICEFEKGFVQVETREESDMGGTKFTPDFNGNVLVARTVNRESFYRILSSTLNDNPFTETKAKLPRVELPPLVVNRAKVSGDVGEKWLADLDNLILELENKWKISVEETLYGGTHAYVSNAIGHDGKQYVLKIDMPAGREHGEFLNGINVLKAADGQGYPMLINYDTKNYACLLERLGMPLKELNYSVDQQIEIICTTLEKTWRVPINNAKFPNGTDSIEWFRSFISETWEELHRPCSEKVIKQAYNFLRFREKQNNPNDHVLIHGDAHSTNTLQNLSKTNSFKLVDPDGIFYEKAYDLGVLMREWPEEYKDDPINSGLERCEYLYQLTGVDKQSIWQWGFLQMVSTAFVLIKIGQEITGKEMLKIAEMWCQMG